MFLFAKFPLFSPRSNLLRFYIFGIERRRLVPTKMLFVEGQVSTDVVDQQHAVTKKYVWQKLKYYCPLLESQKGEAPHSRIDRDSVKRTPPAGKYDFGICALFIQSTRINPRIQFLSKIEFFL